MATSLVRASDGGLQIPCEPLHNRREVATIKTNSPSNPCDIHSNLPPTSTSYPRPMSLSSRPRTPYGARPQPSSNRARQNAYCDAQSAVDSRRRDLEAQVALDQMLAEANRRSTVPAQRPSDQPSSQPQTQPLASILEKSRRETRVEIVRKTTVDTASAPAPPPYSDHQIATEAQTHRSATPQQSQGPVRVQAGPALFQRGYRGICVRPDRNRPLPPIPNGAHLPRPPVLPVPLSSASKRPLPVPPAAGGTKPQPKPRMLP